MYYTKFLRDTAALEGGSGGLQGLVEGLQNLGDPPVPDSGKSADQLAAEAAEAEQTALKAEALDAEGKIKPGYLQDATGKISKDATYVAPAPEPEEGMDADGNLLPGYKKDDTGKVVVDPDYKVPEITEEEQVKEFFDRVAAITGDPIEIEYPEGVDPLSPEGIAHYTSVIREDAALAFEEYLQKKDPRAYAYMLHRAAGKPDDEFLSGNTGFVLPTQDDFDKSADLQAAVFKYNLKVQGLDDESIDVLVKKAIADNKLKEKADAAYKYIDEEQKKQLGNLTKETEDREKAADQAIAGFLGKIDKAISTELNFIVSEQDKPVFRQFVIDSLRYDEGTGSFSIVQKIPDDQLNTMLESLFFQHKKGNLKALVQKQAKTITAQNLRLKLNNVNGGPGSGKAGEKADENFIPLGDIKVV